MPRKHSRPAAQGSGPATHFCAHPGCDTRIRLDQLMHPGHWQEVPRSLRVAYGQAKRQGDAKAALRAGNRIIEWARNRAGVSA